MKNVSRLAIAATVILFILEGVRYFYSFEYWYHHQWSHEEITSFNQKMFFISLIPDIFLIMFFLKLYQKQPK
jgi:hypothetical protein